jgi:hypothetical protein
MRSAFRTGQLRVCPQLLETIPRPALIQAIVVHATTQPDYDGQPIRTNHQHQGRRFYLETGTNRESTEIRLS